MRVQLEVRSLGIAAILLFLTDISYGQDREVGEGEATTRSLVYTDDDATTVVSTYVGAKVTVPGDITISTHALIDAVSSASVDVVSAATSRWQENRVEAGMSIGGVFRKQELSLGIVRSQENDWRSLSLSASTAREFFQRNTRVFASVGLTGNDIGRSQDPTFTESLTVWSAETGVFQLLDPRTRAGLTFSAQLARGFQSSPYRYVSSLDRSTMPEAHPSVRNRYSLAAFALRSLAETTSLRAGYRLYRDDWGIWSHTGSLALRTRFAKRFSVGLSGRFYHQNKADFYKNSYPTHFRYMSADRELATFRDISAQSSVQAQVGPVLLDAKAGIIHYRFANFSPLPKRRAYLFGGGAKLSW